MAAGAVFADLVAPAGAAVVMDMRLRHRGAANRQSENL